MYVDIHCHLDALKDPEQVVNRAVEAGVSLILTNGLNKENNEQALALQNRFSSVRAALGLYPNDAIALSGEERAEVYAQIRENDPVAIGEIGLDFHHDDTHKQEMQAVFEEVLSLAEELQKPVLVHSRKAEKEVLETLSSFNVTADLHCFGGKLTLAKQAADHGHYFSVPTAVVRSTHFQRLCQEVPRELLLSETDAPWMSPDENPNEPRNVVVGVKAMADARKERLDELREQLFRNAHDFLSLS